MWPFKKQSNEVNPPAAKPEPETIMLYAKDDLMARAEKIVWVLGYRGYVAGPVLEIYKTLKIYEDLDNGVYDTPPPEPTKLEIVK